ncbi:MAG: hypothetical protein ACK5Y6_06980 [Pseudomonadota bacterium]
MSIDFRRDSQARDLAFKRALWYNEVDHLSLTKASRSKNLKRLLL